MVFILFVRVRITFAFAKAFLPVARKNFQHAESFNSHSPQVSRSILDFAPSDKSASDFPALRL